MKKSFLFSLQILLFTISSCKPIAQNHENYLGKWVSLGGNWLLEIDSNGDYAEYDFTSMSCQVARKSNIKEFGDRIFLSQDTLKIKRGVIEYKYIRTTKDYPLCYQILTEDQKRDPVFNFEVFSSTILENYAFMNLNKVNWNVLYNECKEVVTNNPTDESLYYSIQRIFDVINDNHGYIEPPEEVIKSFQGIEDSTAEIGDFKVANEVSKNHMIEEYTYDSNIVRWGKMTDSIGYIQVKAMFLLSNLGITQKEIDDLGFETAYNQKYYALNEGEYIELERESMNRVMERVYQDLSSFESIIVDIRFNGGGQDAVSLELLSWFNNFPKLMAIQSLFYNNVESPEWNIIINSNKEYFNGNTYVLTSKQTGSAAEVFAMGTMILPNVKRIGMPTMGALSTALEKKLPNGWKFTVSNEYYRNSKGDYFENRGIPVDYTINYPANRQEFFNSVLRDLELDKNQILKAINELNNSF